MEPRRIKMPVAGVLLFATLLAGCEGEEDPLPDPIRAGFSEEPPFAFVAEDGAVRGEAPETLRRAAAALGLSEPDWIRLDFDELLPALRSGRIDVAASGHLATPERTREVAFTHPTVCPPPALLVRGEVAERVGSLSELVQETDLGVVVLGGSTEEEALARLGMDPGRILVVYDVRSAVLALQDGSSDAFPITLPTARWMARSPGGEGLVAVGPYGAPPELSELLEECSALALRPGDLALRNALNRVLPGVLADEDHRTALRALGFDSLPLPDAEDPAP